MPGESPPLTPETLRAEREKLRLSSDDLGALMGVSGAYVRGVETGHHPWTPALAERARRALSQVRANGGELPTAQNEG